MNEASQPCSHPRNCGQLYATTILEGLYLTSGWAYTRSWVNSETAFSRVDNSSIVCKTRPHDFTTPDLKRYNHSGTCAVVRSNTALYPGITTCVGPSLHAADIYARLGGGRGELICLLLVYPSSWRPNFGLLQRPGFGRCTIVLEYHSLLRRPVYCSTSGFRRSTDYSNVGLHLAVGSKVSNHAAW
jgi:hypothetical protein